MRFLAVFDSSYPHGYPLFPVFLGGTRGRGVDEQRAAGGLVQVFPIHGDKLKISHILSTNAIRLIFAHFSISAGKLGMYSYSFPHFHTLLIHTHKLVL
jgi:hypothetical protein